jgi:quinol monooxygenase YgiN
LRATICIRTGKSLAFYMIERWSSDEALQAHDASAHIQSLRAGRISRTLRTQRLQALA